ncbi:hypothetical protein [Chitinilyticum litopenaei]|uniref:hypothetical protein n=1 Tax=Chitinilyticum litopenaei TaxID=1121276 RepID=UPI00040C0F3C|nr:hypothetical protein [Chitinilyticum litopenaei]
MTTTRKTLMLSAMAAALLSYGMLAEAAPRAKGEARSSVNKPATANRGAAPRAEAAPRANVQNNTARNTNATRNTKNTNVRNTNVNNINIDRDVNIDVDGGGCHGGCWDNDYHPIATAAAITATAAVIGSIVNSVPPNCVPVVYANITYQQCGNTWYQPQYQGSNVTYIVVNPPR